MNTLQKAKLHRYGVGWCNLIGEYLHRVSGDRIPVGATFSAPVQTGPRIHPASCTMGTGSFPGVKNGRVVTLIPHTFLVPWSRKSRAVPLLPLWAVRPVQSLSACTRVQFTCYLLPVSGFVIQFTLEHATKALMETRATALLFLQPRD